MNCRLQPAANSRCVLDLIQHGRFKRGLLPMPVQNSRRHAHPRHLRLQQEEERRALLASGSMVHVVHNPSRVVHVIRVMVWRRINQDTPSSLAQHDMLENLRFTFVEGLRNQNHGFEAHDHEALTLPTAATRTYTSR